MSTLPLRYSPLSSLGKGGMGEVWLADDTQLGRKVAIKFVTEALGDDPTARERLFREARSAAALDHPFICKIYEIADVDGRTGIVMEHVSGETLRVVLDRAPLGAPRALQLDGGTSGTGPCWTWDARPGRSRRNVVRVGETSLQASASRLATRVPTRRWSRRAAIGPPPPGVVLRYGNGA